MNGFAIFVGRTVSSVDELRRRRHGKPQALAPETSRLLGVITLIRSAVPRPSDTQATG